MKHGILRFALTVFFVCFGVVQLHANWKEASKVLASDGVSGDRFGHSVAIDGNYAVVGSYREDHLANGGGTIYDAGAVYIFELNGTVWSQQQKLIASDSSGYDYFGASVAISGDTVIVGAYQEDENASGEDTLSSAGSAYIFTRNGTTWSEQQKLVASDRGFDDHFGGSVAISGDTAIVGAQWEDQGVGSLTEDAGAAYIFERSGTVWSQQQKLVASDRAANDWFGHSVGISGDTVIVGAVVEDENVSGGDTLANAGSAYIFVRGGTTWTQQQKLVASDRAAEDVFGSSVAISGDTVIVGAEREDENTSGGDTMSLAGSAYIFERSGTVWSQQQKLVASDRTGEDNFGYSVAISGNTVIVGAHHEDEDASGGNTRTNAGSAYIFQRSGSTWNQQQKLVASDRTASDYFGANVAISGNTVIAGAWGREAAYLFSADTANPALLMYLLY